VSEPEVVRRGRRFAVRFEDAPSYAFEGTKRACLGWIEWSRQVRAELAQFEAGKAARLARLLAERGLRAIDYRQLKPGDLFTWRPEDPLRAVTDVRHFDSGASLVFWPPDRYTPPAWAMVLMVPGWPAAYGPAGEAPPQAGQASCDME
jgi:hypothetical protein